MIWKMELWFILDFALISKSLFAFLFFSMQKERKKSGSRLNYAGRQAPSHVQGHGRKGRHPVLSCLQDGDGACTPPAPSLRHRQGPLEEDAGSRRDFTARTGCYHDGRVAGEKAFHALPAMLSAVHRR